MSKNIIKLNSENIKSHEIQIKDDIKIRYQNITNCSNIYYEEIKKNRNKKNIKIFLFIQGKPNKQPIKQSIKQPVEIKIKIDNCISLLKEKINEQIIDFEILKNITIYKNYKITIDNSIQKHKIIPTDLFYVIFPLFVKTNDYKNFLKKFNEEYNEKFKDNLFDEKNYLVEKFFNDSILRLPYYIYPDINKDQRNRYNIFFPCSILGSRLSRDIYETLRYDTSVLIEKEKNRREEDQNKEINIIYGIYQNIFKDKLKYIEGKRYKNEINFKDIKLMVNDYENNEIKVEEFDDEEESGDMEEESENDNNEIDLKSKEDKGENTIPFIKFQILSSDCLNLLNAELNALNYCDKIFCDHKFKTHEDLLNEVTKIKKKINEFKKNSKDDN